MTNSIENHIDRLRSKPEHVRKRIAFVTSFSVSLFILLAWMASYGINTSSVSEKIASKTPLASLTASVDDITSYIKDLFTSSNSAEYSSGVEVVPGKR